MPFAVEAIAVQGGGKVPIGGSIPGGIARLNIDGSFDSGFNPPQIVAPAPRIDVVVAQMDGKSVVSGVFTKVNLNPRNGLARLNGDGTLDQSFNPDISVGQINAMVLQSDGKLLAVGSEVNPKSRSGIARFNSDGTLDQSFNPDSRFDGSDGFHGPMTCAVQSNGQLLIAGFDIYGLARLNSDGSMDQAFHLTALGPPPDLNRGYVSSIAVQSDGKIIIGGHFGSVNGVARTNLARLNPDGTLDTGYQPLYWGGALLLQPDGKLLIGGCVRLNPDGSLDPSFDSSEPFRCFDSVQPLLLQTGRIFGTVPFGFYNRPALFNGDGTLNETFVSPDFGRYAGIRALAEQPDGAVLVAGHFSQVDGQPSFGLIRFKATTAPKITGLKYESGSFFLTLSGDSSRSYRVETSTDLITWLTLTNFTSSATSTAVVDSNAGTFQHRFYRATTVSQ